MSKNFVDANYRFIAAYQEVNARIIQRQQVLALYVTLVVSLLAALVALRPAPGNPTPPVEWLILGFPVASMCLALLNYKAERSITNLRTFLAKLEKLEDAHLTLPSYNTEPQWSSGALGCTQRACAANAALHGARTAAALSRFLRSSAHAPPPALRLCPHTATAAGRQPGRTHALATSDLAAQRGKRGDAQACGTAR